MRSRVRKVLCYVVRDGSLLVFRHRDHPAAGLQVPAGTVEPGEDPDRAVLREVAEETGRGPFTIRRALGSFEHDFDEGERHERHERYVFVLAPPDGLPEEWSHFAEGAYWFEFSWTPVHPAPPLAVPQGALLGSI